MEGMVMSFIRNANPDATNSELDAKKIVHNVTFDDYPFADDPFENLDGLTDAQIYDIIKQYVEVKVDRMDTQELVEHVTQDLTDWYSDFSLEELKDSIDVYDEGLFDELVDNCGGKS
jgi:hypothetical protein